ncbi:hypothetical protein [Rhodococcus sp. MTM3W5.2]|nr:hypothetical protein [Rhodococcus sp. MTM3W5.2]
MWISTHAQGPTGIGVTTDLIDHASVVMADQFSDGRSYMGMGIDA